MLQAFLGAEGRGSPVRNTRVSSPHTKSYDNLIFKQSRWTVCQKLLIQKIQIGNLWDDRAPNGAWQREEAQKQTRSQLLHILPSNEHKQGERGSGRSKVSGFCLELRKSIIFPKNTTKNPENATRMALGLRSRLKGQKSYLFINTFNRHALSSHCRLVACQVLDSQMNDQY